MKDFIKIYWRFIIGGFICLILLIGGSVWAYTVNNKYEKKEIEVELKETEKEADKSDELVYVDIKGEVDKPGVYEVSSKANVSQVIKQAGGLTENANTDYINLSKKIKDEMVIIIYSNQEIADLKQDMTIKYQVKVLEKPCPDSLNDACLNEVVQTESINEEKVSLNKATKEELLTLSGIGESKALAIIKYRDEQGFKQIEDLKNVTGIGDALYEKIKDRLTL